MPGLFPTDPKFYTYGAYAAEQRATTPSPATAGVNSTTGPSVVPTYAASKLLVFPTDLRNSTLGAQYAPYIAFSYKDNQGVPRDRVFLPMPPGLEISDSMSYSTIDLGQIGDIASKAITAMANENTITGAIGAGISAGVADLKNKFQNAKTTELIKIGLQYTGQESRIPVIDYATSSIRAPNTNTTFQGSNIRRYQFRFKMVARERAESTVIKDIVNAFRTNLYPEGNDVSMEFPGTWDINFYSSGENTYLPKVYRCFMTDFSSAYNTSTANMWHEDGSPVEVDITMSFQEVRALRKKDIQDLKA